MQCPACNAAFRMHERNCPVCDADVGYPNVRAALAPDEVAALNERGEQASKSCAQRQCAEPLEQFRDHVRESRAVLCRSLSQVMTLVSSDNELYASFYSQVSAHTRRPEETVVEQERLVADSLLFPFYKDEIRFAALSIDGEGVTKYGTCSLVLKDAAIRQRATVFEKNSLEFCRERKLGVGSPVPPGYRASWKDRETLAAAKLHESVERGSDSASFAHMLLNNETGDFVEVHVFGPIHRGAVEAINMTELSHKSDEALSIEIERRAEEFGAAVRQKKNA
jgi:hypothetical protein